MGLFDFFKKKPRVSLEQLSYDVAYQIFPAYAFTQLPALLDIVASSPDTANALFYQIACRERQVEADRSAAAQYRWHKTVVDGAGTCLVLEYPAPAPIDLSGQSFEDVTRTVGTWVIAPYFSAVVKDDASGLTAYFVLGQTSMGGGTVLRRIDADGVNANLGPGPEPTLDAFLCVINRADRHPPNLAPHVITEATGGQPRTS